MRGEKNPWLFSRNKRIIKRGENKMALTKERKSEIVREYARNNKDTGST